MDANFCFTLFGNVHILGNPLCNSGIPNMPDLRRVNSKLPEIEYGVVVVVNLSRMCLHACTSVTCKA